MVGERIGQRGFDRLRDARSHYAWTEKPVSEEILREVYEITIAGPTSMNTCPARFVFATSAEGKDRLAKSLKAEEHRQDEGRTCHRDHCP